MNLKRTEYCFYFAVTYSVAVGSDLVDPSFKDMYSQLC